MYPEGLVWVVNGLMVIWLLSLTFFIWRNFIFIKKLFPEQKGDFKLQLEEVFSELRSVRQLKSRSWENIQKVALKRYNPYHDTGGDQSFSLALLNGKGDGVIITSLHSRAGTRVFAKSVKGGHDGNVQMSNEEREVVNKALGA